MKTKLKKNHFVNKKLSFSIIENGMILPHKRGIPGHEFWGGAGIVNSKGEYISNSFIHAGWGTLYTPPLESIQYRSETVIYLGMFYPVWGHVLTDNIRRMWFLKSDIFKKELKNCPLVYVSWRGLPLEQYPNFQRLLEIMEVDVNEFQAIEQPTQFDKIIFPDDSFTPAFKFTNEYCETIDYIRNFALRNRTSTASKKIYYFYGRGQIGEERLAEYFRSKGYEIVSPEKLSLEEQLNLLINCESFASTLGSISHNSIFLPNKTETIFIPRASYFTSAYQKILNQVNDCKCNYVDSTLSIFSKKTPRANCFIISEQLKRFFGDKFNGYEDDDFKIFLQYAKKFLGKSNVIDPKTEAAYKSFLPGFIEQLLKREDLIKAYGMPHRWEYFRPLLNYQTHVGTKGWGDGEKSEDQISNPLDQKRDIQAIKINFPDCKIYYSVYYNDEEGWSKEVLAPEMAGTTGKAKSIYGIRIRLDEAGAKKFDIFYRVHKFDDTWTSWAKNGETIYSHGVKLNAIQIKLEPTN